MWITTSFLQFMAEFYLLRLNGLWADQSAEPNDSRKDVFVSLTISSLAESW